MIAMAGMYFAGAATFTSFATGTIVVVAVAMLGSLTVLPAVLSVLGDRVEKGRVPGLGRLRDRVARDRHLVAHRGPGAASPAAVGRAGHRRCWWRWRSRRCSMDMGTPSTSASLPQDEPVVQTFNRVQEAFPAETSSLDVVVKAEDVTAPAVTGGLAELEQAAAEHKSLLPGDGRRDRTSAPTRPSRRSRWRSPATGRTRSRAQALDVLRDEVVAPDDRIGRRRGGLRRRRDRGRIATSTTR